MRYFIAHVLHGESALYHTNLNATLADRYSLPRLAERIMPHITLKAPFEATDEQIRDLTQVLDTFVQSETISRCALHGFGKLDEKIAYIGVDPSARLVETLGRFDTMLQEKLPWLPYSQYDGPNRTLHSTVAKADKPEIFNAIWNDLTGEPTPHFEVDFDSISLLMLVEKAWQIKTYHRLQKQP